MKTLLLTPCSGLAGDMFVAALLDAGADVPAFWQQLSALPLVEHACDVRANSVMRRGIAATQFVVELGQEDNQHLAHDHQHEHAHAHRSLADVLRIIEAAELKPPVQAQATTVFTALADAEAAVHGKTRDSIHFHEVGAFDAIVDIVAACIALDVLEIQQVVSSPPAIGSGTVQCAHGVMPVPAPAVARLLQDLPVISGTAQRELVTPTGAALLKALCTAFDGKATGTLLATGYGAGSWDNPQQANVLQASILQTAQSVETQLETPPVWVLETNLDDMPGERYSHLFPLLLDAGALDVLALPCTMKKGRPGVLLQVLAPANARDTLAELILAESSSFGVRWHQAQRTILQRRIEEVETPYGSVLVKIGWHAHIQRFSPEYESCHAVAGDTGEPFADIYDAALQAARTLFSHQTKEDDYVD